MSQRIIILAGNDGVGKTSTVARLQQLLPNDIIAERSSIPKELPENIACWLARQTLYYTFEKFTGDGRPDLPTVFKDTHIYWFILDAPVSVLMSRLQSRDHRDKWESERAVTYFRARYREMSGYYGIPLIDTTQSPGEVCKDIIHLLAAERYHEISQFALHNLTTINIENQNVEYFLEHIVNVKKSFPPDFDFHHLLSYLDDIESLRLKCWARYNLPNYNLANLSFKNSLLELVAEGESKRVYRPYCRHNNKWLQQIAIICLKPTIYSHSKQATGTIEGLEKIRARGTMMFLEMMYRHGLQHSYRSINEYGIILSDFIEEVPPTEIVVKKYCEGTDKHSFYGLQQLSAVVNQTNGKYQNGEYVRFDWRNPNHIDPKTHKTPTESIYYYLVEEALGKERFFEVYLKNLSPLGDKCISSDLLVDIIDVKTTRRSALKMFKTINEYFQKVGLEIQDCCFMLDRSGTVFWSEINQDCMRIKVLVTSDSLDKDVWRAGGSSSKQLVVEKWTTFSDIMEKYFMNNRFHRTEMMMTTVTQSVQRRRVIVTLDIFEQQPVLVKQGVVYQTHSDHNLFTAFNYISLFPDILVVDLNGALSTEKRLVNRPVIKQLAQQHYVHVGGGIRTIEDAQDILSSSARRIVVSSNTDPEFIRQLPRERLIVELSVNPDGEVLTHGRTVNTGVHIFERLDQLVSDGVEAISVTFHQSEGGMGSVPLPRQQIAQLVTKVPTGIKKIIIAGGISTIDDLEYLWSFPRVIPQLGSAIWKKQLSIGDVYAAMVRPANNDGLLPAIIQDTHGRNKGLVYMNSEALCLTCNERQLYRYSRQHQKLMRKGAQSGNIQHVVQISTDCDNDALLITVDTAKPFCHTQNYSCFSLQTVVKANIASLTEHIASRITGSSYSSVMQKNPGFALAKLMEEFWEIVTADGDYKHIQIHECADMLVHLLMYLNGHDISIEDILNELNARRWDPHLIKPVETKPLPNTIVLAVTTAKYTSKTDDFMEQCLGVKLIRGGGRNLRLDYQISDIRLYNMYFGNKQLCFIGARPKDMPWLIAMGRVDGAITYNTVISNYPPVYRTVLEEIDPSVKLALIKKEGVDVHFTNSKQKVTIAAEHPKQVYNYLRCSGIAQDQFTLDHILGSSESYIVNADTHQLCDAIVETGSTLKENGLSIWRTVLNHGEVKIGLYMHLLK